MEDSAKALTPPLIDIADARIRSLAREFRDRRFWMERHWKRIPLSDRFVSEWNLARGLTTLAVASGLAISTAAYMTFINNPSETPKQTILTLGEPIAHPEKQSVEQEPLKTSVSGEFENYRHDKKRVERTLQWKNMIEQIVKDPRLGINPQDQQYWINTMLEIIFVESGGNSNASSFVESGGNPNASSPVAYGLTQLKAETARQVANQYQIPKYDLYNGWDNVFLGLAHQLYMEKLYGRELAKWIHHLGMGNGTQAIITYLVSSEKLPIWEVDRIFQDPTNQLLRQYIEKYQITPEKLLKSPTVTGKLKQIGAFDDDTQHYPARLRAAAEAMKTKA